MKAVDIEKKRQIPHGLRNMLGLVSGWSTLIALHPLSFSNACECSSTPFGNDSMSCRKIVERILFNIHSMVAEAIVKLSISVPENIFRQYLLKSCVFVRAKL